MKYLLPLSSALIILSSCGSEEEKVRTPKIYTIEQLYNNVTVRAVAFNSDESEVLISNNSTGIFNLFEISIADTTTTKLSSSTNDALYGVDYLPGTSKFIYSSDQGGNENKHLYLKSDSDSAIDVTPWPGSANTFADWSEDQTALYIKSNRRDPRYMDLWKMDTATWTPTILFQNDSGYNLGLMSKNERYVTVMRAITNDINEMFMYDRTTKLTRKISHGLESSWRPLCFEKNDNIFYYSTNDGSEFHYICKYDIASGMSEKFLEENWGIENMELSKNEKYHTVFINEDGKTKVRLFDHATNKAIEFPEIPDGDVTGVIISQSEEKLLMSVGSSTSPTNLFVYTIANKELKQITSTLNKEIDQNDLVKAEVVRFKSFDGTEIPAIYYKPLIASKDHKVPALVFVHGGPGGQSRVGFSNSIQHLVNNGYAVLAVNNRGSSGYGKTFYAMDDRDHSNGDLKDCIWGKEWLQQQDYIDTNAIGIYGGSYGGCMVLGALAFHPEEFKVGVDVFGVANWLRTLRNIPAYWEAGRRALYDELGDPNTTDSVRLRNISPLYNYEKINKPLLVIQGANDVRVLQVESDEIVAGVKKNNVPVEYIVFPDEGHGFVKKENQITAANTTLAFLEKYLRSKPAE